MAPATARGQVIDHRNAEYARTDHHQGDDYEGAPRRSDGQDREPVQH
jgi:hypothetical protein